MNIEKPAITSARTAQRSARVNLTDLNKMLKENNVLMNTTPTLPGRSPLRCAPLALEEINEEEEHRHSLRKSHSSTSLQEGSCMYFFALFGISSQTLSSGTCSGTCSGTSRTRPQTQE